MICLSDSDILIKLAEFDLLDPTWEMLKVGRSDIRVLPELIHVLNGTKILNKHTRDGVERALKFAKGIKKLDKIDPAEHILLSSVSVADGDQCVAINGGEAILYSSTKFLSDFTV